MRRMRGMGQQQCQLGERRGAALRFYPHAGRVIAGRSGQTKLAGGSAHPGPETHALHDAKHAPAAADRSDGYLK